MKIHEYQAEALLRQYGIPCPEGYAAFSPEEAVEAAKKLNGEVYVVKAQVHSGGRGKAGGVKLARGLSELREKAEAIYGMKLVTRQTGPQGKLVRRLLVCEGIDIAKEYYVSLTQDGARGQIVLIASAEGGTEIEVVAQNAPNKISQCGISPDIGLRSYQAGLIANCLGLNADERRQFTKIVQAMYALFTQKDCSLVEINPLVVTRDGRMLASDAKVNFDDNALFRHPDVQALRDPDEEDPHEVQAAKFDLNYVQLDGDIGCMVNGAGLAMATMDIIKSFGGAPANFLDVGGSATREKVAGAFSILLSDSQVRGIFINIFGGIMKCDVIAQGVVDAAKEMRVNVPLVLRLEGTNAAQGKRILASSGLNLHAADDMADGARKICALVKAAKEALA